MLKYLQRKPRNPFSKLLHDEHHLDTGGIINYQRFASTAGDPDPPHLRYRNNILAVRFDRNDCAYMKSVQCVDTPTAKLYVTFAGVAKFYYVVENFFYRQNTYSYFRVTGMLEPSALIKDRDLEYFLNQLANSQSR